MAYLYPIGSEIARRGQNFYTIFQDFFASGSLQPFASTLINGSLSFTTITGQNRWGIATVLGNGINTNSGITLRTNTGTNTIRIASDLRLVMEFGIYFNNLTGKKTRFGLGTFTNNSNDLTDGCYFEVIGTTMNGKTALSSSRSTTSTSYTLSAATWYVARLTIDGISSARFQLIAADNSSILFDNSVTTTLPTATNMSIGLTATTDAASTNPITSVDYISAGWEALQRL